MQGSLTIGVDDPRRQEEGDEVADHPQRDLDKPAPVLQVLVPLVPLVLYAQHGRGQQPEEELHKGRRGEQASWCRCLPTKFQFAWSTRHSKSYAWCFGGEIVQLRVSELGPWWWLKGGGGGQAEGRTKLPRLTL